MDLLWSSKEGIQRHRPITDIPFDIWSNVASFLPLDHRRTLYSVNHAFFVIAMDDRYKTVHLGGDGKNETISKSLSCLSYTPRAQRVHTLYLYPDVIAGYLPRRPVSMMKAILTHIQQPTNGPVVSETDGWHAKTELMVKVIRNMPNIQELTLCPSFPRPDTPPRLRDLEYVLRTITTNIWSAFGSNLMALTLNLSYDGYFCALTPTLVLPHLERLTITLSELNRTSNGTKLLCDLLIPFVNNHHSTLRHLQLALISYGHLDISPCFLGMCRLPHLRQLHFHHIFNDKSHINTLGLHHILEIHSDVLRELELRFELPYLSIPSPKWYAQGFSDIALPGLESLTLWPGSYLDLHRTTTYLGRVGDSLTTLVLEHGIFPCSDVETVVNAFTGRDILRTLHLSVLYLSPELFDLLAAKLLGLNFLKLISGGVCISESEQRDDDEHLFCQSMRHRLYPNWKLRHFVARLVNTVEKKSTVLSQWKAAIGVAIPHLQTVRIEQY